MTAEAYRWPGGASGAVLVTFDVDGEAPHLWRARANGFRVGELEQRRFGPRQGVHRLLELLAGHGLRSTFYVPASVARWYPAVVAEITAAGHELAMHGDLHEPPGDLTPEEFRAVTSESADVLAATGGARPVGYRSPSWDMTVAALEILIELGVEHDSSLMGHDHPYWIGPMVEVPVDWTADDAPFYRYVGAGDTRPPTPPEVLVGSWRHELAAATRFGTLLNLTMHPWLSGRPARALSVDGLLADVVASGLWTGTVGELARWHAAEYSDTTRLDPPDLGAPGDG